MPETLRRVSAVILAIVMVASAVLHAYWALGGSWFLATALNMEVERMPTDLVALTWIFVVGMLVAAVIALARSGSVKLPLPAWLLAAALWVIAILMFAGAVYNALLPRFWDRWVFAPVFLVVAVLSLIVALPARETDGRRAG